MAMATALVGSGPSVAAALPKSCGAVGSGLQRVRVNSSTRGAWKKLTVPVVASKMESSQIPDQMTVGASALAGSLFAAMASSDSALAAQQIAALAADDNRGLALLIPLVPALGWVLYNILQPALNQLNKMKSAKGLVAGLGLGALGSLAYNSEAEAAVQEITKIADNDNRGTLLLAVLIPAVGWVLYNILTPALNQLNKMRNTKGVVAGLGLGALGSLAFSPEAEAAVQELTQIADNDSRGTLLLGILIPAIGWVLYNILQPALNQLNKMKSSKGVIGAIGLGGLASLLLTPHADAAQEVVQIADGDNRGILLLGAIVPALGWVLYNILQPALNQLNKMRSAKGLVGAVSIGAAAASLLTPGNAEAAQEITQLAEDNRPLILLVVLLPALGWVLFNILKPALNQLDKMNKK